MSIFLTNDKIPLSINLLFKLSYNVCILLDIVVGDAVLLVLTPKDVSLLAIVLHPS